MVVECSGLQIWRKAFSPLDGQIPQNLSKWFSVLQVLRKVRGAASVDGPLQAELEDIQKAVAQTQNEHTSVFAGLTTLFKHYPQILFAAVIIPIAQQFTGMNAIMFVSSALSCTLRHLAAAQNALASGFFANRSSSLVLMLKAAAYQHFTDAASI